MRSSDKVGSAFLMSVALFFFLSMTGIGSSLGYLGSLLLSQLAILVPVIWCVGSSGKKPSEQLTIKRMKLLDIGLCILYYVCARYVIEFVNMLSLLYSDNVTSEHVLRLADELPFVVCALVMAVLPAVCEELMFRGLLYTKFRRISPLWAVLLCSGLFGVLHGNLNQFTYTVLAGFILIVLVEATGSLFSSIIVHCLINIRSVIILYALPALADKLNISSEEVTQRIGAGKPNPETILKELPNSGITAVCAGICGFLIVRYIAKRNNRTENLKGMFRKKATGNELTILQESIFSTPLIVGIALAITYMILAELSIRGMLQ